MRVAPNWMLQEFIDPTTYKKWGDRSIWFIDKRIINIAQHLRERIGKPMVINNWSSGGNYKLSGFRPPQTSIGAKLSQHRFGRAADFKILGEVNNGADIIRDEIITNFSHYQKLGLTTIEHAKYAPTWCHGDCRETNSEELLIIKP